MDTSKLGRREIQEMLRARLVCEPVTGEEVKLKGARYVACLCRNPVKQCCQCDVKHTCCDRIVCDAESRKDHKDIYLKRLY